MSKPVKTLLVEMTRTWEDLGLVFPKGLCLVVADAPPGDTMPLPESDFYYFHLYHISKGHCRLVEKGE
jgi:hypothetical protein